MDKEQLILRLFQVVAKGLRHKHYNHVVAKHKLYMQLVAGVGLDDLLKRYVLRESPELFKQRKIITQHITTSVSKNLLDIFYKVPRSNSARRILTYKTDEDNAENLETRVKAIEEILSKYWGTESWDDYMATRFIELNAIDPNSFVVTEWDKFDATKQNLQPRPYEVSCTAAVDYVKKNKVLQYLIVKDEHIYKTPSLQTIIDTEEQILDPMHGKVRGEKYTLYMKNETLQLLQVHENVFHSNHGVDTEGKITVIADKNYVKLNQKYFEILEFPPHNANQVIAFQPGYYRDLATNGETYVNPLHAIEPYMLKSIKTNSEFDIVAANIALPQQVSYGPACVDNQCHNGYYDGNIECKTCHGTGMQPTAPSSQDAIRIKLPKNKEEMIPLSDLITYVRPPVDIVKWQEEYIEKLTQKMQTIMFNTDVFNRKQVADTATGKTLDMQNVYDTLHPFSVKFSKTWVFGATLFAKLTDKEKDLVASYSFGKDFKLKTLDTLIMDLSILNNINNPALKNHINDDIANIIFCEQPLQLQRYKLKQIYSPFVGKNEKEIMMLMLSPYITKQEKVLHANFSIIFDTLELASLGAGKKDFYKLSRVKQREAIYAEVDALIARLDKENPDPEVPLGE